ncbi:hypothetical protein BUGL105410_36595 [Burkholderia gladioli]
MGLQPERLLQHPFPIRTRDHPKRRVHDQAARPRPLFLAQPHALDHCRGLRRPIEEDHQRPEHLPVRLAALADRGGIGRHLGIPQLRQGLHVERHVIGPAAGGQCRLEPLRPAHLLPDHRIRLAAPASDHRALRVHHPQILVDRITVEDHRQPLARVPAHLLAVVGHAIHHRRIGGPPAHVAGAFIEVAVDDIDHVQREIGTTLPVVRVHAIDHAVAEFGQPRQRTDQFLVEDVGDLADPLRDMLHLVGHHGEPLAGLAGARRLDQRVEREEGGFAIDVVDVADLAGGEAPDFVRQVDDCAWIGHGGVARS